MANKYPSSFDPTALAQMYIKMKQDKWNQMVGSVGDLGGLIRGAIEADRRLRKEQETQKEKELGEEAKYGMSMRKMAKTQEQMPQLQQQAGLVEQFGQRGLLAGKGAQPFTPPPTAPSSLISQFEAARGKMKQEAEMGEWKIPESIAGGRYRAPEAVEKRLGITPIQKPVSGAYGGRMNNLMKMYLDASEYTEGIDSMINKNTDAAEYGKQEMVRDATRDTLFKEFNIKIPKGLSSPQAEEKITMTKAEFDKLSPAAQAQAKKKGYIIK